MTADDRNPDAVPHYEIRVKGRLERRWSAWFNGLTIDTDATDGTTAIRGPVVDQAALHGLLQRLADVGLTLVSLTELPSDTPHHTHHDTSSNTSTERSARTHQEDT